jgi:hypothetical protein
MVRQMSGDWAGAEVLLRTGVDAASVVGDEWTAGAGCWLLAKGTLHAGDAVGAAAQAADVVVRAGRDGNRTLLLLGTLLLAGCLPDLGRPELAWRVLGAVDGLTARTGQRAASIDPTDTPWLTSRVRAAPVEDSAGELARGRAWDDDALLQEVARLRAGMRAPSEG